MYSEIREGQEKSVNDEGHPLATLVHLNNELLSRSEPWLIASIAPALLECMGTVEPTILCGLNMRQEVKAGKEIEVLHPRPMAIIASQVNVMPPAAAVSDVAWCGPSGLPRAAATRSDVMVKSTNAAL